jgi:hypothetical protein
MNSLTTMIRAYRAPKKIYASWLPIPRAIYRIIAKAHNPSNRSGVASIN